MSNSPQSITHPGIIDHIDREKILVKVLAESACASCHAKGYCSMGETKEKMVEVDSTQGKNWKSGDEVMVVMDRTLGSKAVLLAYVIPLAVLLGSVILLVILLGNEGLAALIALGLLVPYYLLLYFFRDRFQREFRFRIEPMPPDSPAIL